MKLNFVRRLVLFLHWLLSLIACVLAVVLCVWPDFASRGFALLHSLVGKGAADIIGVVLLAIYAVLSALSVVMLFSGRAKRADRAFITVDSSDTGRTRIAIGAVEQMIRQAVRGVEGISDMKCGIVNREDAISINCNVAIANGAHVPTVTMNMQRAIRSYIELNCGVAVRDVSVSIHSLDSGEGGKLGRKKGFSAAASAPAAPALAPEMEDASVQQGAPEAENAAEPAVEQSAEIPEIEPISLTLDPPEEAEETRIEDIE